MLSNTEFPIELIAYPLIWVGLGLFLNIKCGTFKRHDPALRIKYYCLIAGIIVFSPLVFLYTFIYNYLFAKWN